MHSCARVCVCPRMTHATPLCDVSVCASTLCLCLHMHTCVAHVVRTWRAGIGAASWCVHVCRVGLASPHTTIMHPTHVEQRSLTHALSVSPLWCPCSRQHCQHVHPNNINMCVPPFFALNTSCWAALDIVCVVLAGILDQGSVPVWGALIHCRVCS